MSLAVTAMRGAENLGFILPNQASNSALNGLMLRAERFEAGWTRGKATDRSQPRPAQADSGYRREPRCRWRRGLGTRCVGNGQGRHQTRVERLVDPEHDPGGECLRRSWHLIPLAASQAPGGGAALPPRGGSSVSGPARGSTRGAITPLTLPASTPAASNTGGSSPALPAGAAGAIGTKAGTTGGSDGSAPAQSSATNAGADTPVPLSVVSIPTTPISGIAENASSLPSGTKASGPFGALVSFPYFPLYTLDYIQGTDWYQTATNRPR